MTTAFKKKSFVTLIDGIWRNNPTFRTILGICSALAVTNQLKNTIAMGLGVAFVTALSSTTIAMMRKIIPDRIRLAVSMIVITTYTMMVDIFLRAHYPDIGKALGPYVGLIITNCIILGRIEAFAIRNGAALSFLDGIGAGAGYMMSLLIIALFREALGFGTVFGINVMGKDWVNWNAFALAPGAFFMLACYMWILKLITKCDGNKGCR